MDFEFSPEQLSFVAEVERFLDEHDDPEVFDVTRENMAQIVDTPKRRAFMAEMGEQGWLGITWPKEYGGQEGDGVYEYLLNESLARRGGPQIGKGVGIVGKTIIRHGSERLKDEFLPKILRNEVEFAVGYSEPNAGSDAASMQLKATRDGDGWRLNGQKTWTTSAHFAEWYWVGARTDPTLQALGDHAVPRPPRPTRHHHQRHLDHGGRAHQRGPPRQRLRARRLRRGRAQPRLPVHLRGPRPRALHHVHLLAHRPAPRPAVRVRGRGHARRAPAQGRPGRAPSHRRARHPGRGGPRARAALRQRVPERRRRAHHPRVGVQALRHRAVARDWPTRPWTSPAPARSCG